MFDDFLKYVEEHRLCDRSDRVLLAVSGGIDSMVMLDLFHRSEIPIAVAHCHFRLRGDESAADADFVREKASRAGIPYFQRDFDTRAYARSQGISIQMAARDLRFAWFDKLADEEGYTRIALAHHYSDSLETMLFNLSRGTGLKGLTGMAPRRGRIIRPLLFADRALIEHYARRRELEYREDSSNRDIKYQRNFIRHRLLPLFRELNSNFEDRSRVTLERLRLADEVMSAILSRDRDRFFRQQGKDIYLSVSYFRDFGNPVLLHEVLRAYHFNYDQSARIFHQMQGPPGARFHSGTHVLNIDRESLVVSEQDSDSPLLEVWEEKTRVLETSMGIFTCTPADRIDPADQADHLTEYFDGDVMRFPLELRKWEAGDRFIPLGMKGKKKLSDFMIDSKIPVNLKSRTLVLLSGGEVAWVVGHRIDERFRVREESRRIMKIEYRPF